MSNPKELLESIKSKPKEIAKYRFPSPNSTEAAGRVLQAQDDPFKVLGVNEEDDASTIKSRFRQVLGEVHPDRLGDEVGDFGPTFNRVTEKVIGAYHKLKDHVPPPRTFGELFARKTNQEDYANKTPQEQLAEMLSLLKDMAVEDSTARMFADQYTIQRIENYVRIRAENNIKAILLAYSGNAGFQPTDNQPLPDIENVLETLKSARLHKIILNPETERLYRIIEQKTGRKIPPSYTAYFQIPERPGYTPEFIGKIPDIWLDEFRKVNHIPDLEEGERRLRRAERIQKEESERRLRRAERIQKKGRLQSIFSNFFRRTKTQRKVEQNVENYTAAQSTGQTFETADKTNTAPDVILLLGEGKNKS